MRLAGLSAVLNKCSTELSVEGRLAGPLGAVSLAL